MHKPPLFSRASTCFVLVWVVMAVSPVDSAYAQPDSDASNRFGDRQTGNFGDPGAGHFGNPAAGDFDKYNLHEPAPGTQPSGAVYNGKPLEASPYLSLPAPKDAALLTETVPKKPAAGKKSESVQSARRSSRR